MSKSTKVGDFMLQAVIIDMDGVLLDTERLYVRALEYAGRAQGISGAGKIIVKTLGYGEEESVHIMRRTYGKGLDVNMIYSHFLQYVSAHLKKSPLVGKAGCATLIRYLKRSRIKLAVVTPYSGSYTRHFLGCAQLIDYFDTVVCCDSDNASCQSSDIYREACRKLGVAPTMAVALDDSPRGIQGAARAGLIPIMIPDLVVPDKSVTPYTYACCDSLFDVIGTLQTLIHDSAGRMPKGRAAAGQ